MPLEVPDSLRSLLSLFRPCFTAPTFETFMGLVVGHLTRVGKRTITGCLTAAGLAGSWHHSRAHRFFSAARWSADHLGLLIVELICERVLGEETLRLAVDDTLLERFGPKVFGRCLNRDGSAQPGAGKRLAWGNSWVVAGVLVKLPFLARPICLPVLFRLWRPGAGPTQVELARDLVRLVAEAHPGRRVEVTADGAYAGGALAPGELPANVCLIVRVRRDICLHEPPAPHRGGPGRPQRKGPKLPKLGELAAEPRRWRRVRLRRYGSTDTVELIAQQGLWYAAFGQHPVQAVVVRDRSAADGIEAAIICTDVAVAPVRVVETYSQRWAIEVAFADAKQLGGVGDAENRTRAAVERTAPFAFLCMTLAILWYALHGHAPSDLRERRQRSPWYRTKRTPAFADMLAKLRRSIIAARVSPATGQHLTDAKFASLAQTWELIAA